MFDMWVHQGIMGSSLYDYMKHINSSKAKKT